jgi:CheY-like chemotaxis protein
MMTKILIAEDNPVNRELLRELLENHGYTVIEACDGQEALRMVEETGPDLLLLDIGMPLLDGYAVARKIRENPKLAPFPILAITAYAMQGDREKILLAGFDGYLSKPINASVLASELERLLSGRSAQSSIPNQSPKSYVQVGKRQAGTGK